jgi:hypothetical protein
VSEETPQVEAPPVEVVEEAQEAEQPAEPEVPAWRKALDEAPPEELRNHPKFWGMVGSELESRRERWERDNSERLAVEAAKKLEEELLDLADRDPDALADRFKTDVFKRRQEQGVASLRSGAREEMIRNIGQAYRAMPEWAELTPADHQEFYEALAGKKDDEVLPTFNALAAKKIGDVRARKQIDTWRQTDLQKEREAIRLEEQTRLLQGGDRPGIGRTRGNGTISDEPNWRTEPRKWESWYAQNAGSRR